MMVWSPRLAVAIALAVLGLSGCEQSPSVGISDHTQVSSSATSSAATSAGGVDLVKPSSRLLRYCQAAANRLDWQILCPSLLPADPYFPGTCCLNKRIFLIQEVFQGPPSYVGMPNADGSAGDVGHINSWSIPREALDSSGLGCVEKGKWGGAIDLNGTAAEWTVCPAGRDPPQDSGHIMLQWSNAGVVYAVSAHTDTPENRSLVLFIATHLTLVEPRR
jgi:hypothetical protein